MGSATESSVPLRVVIVDDDPLVLAVMRRVLLRAGYEVTTFDDPTHAAREIPALAPLAVVTDLNMPDLGGRELLELVRTQVPSSLRVLFTGDGDVEELSAELTPSLAHAVLAKAAGMQLLPDALARLRRGC